MMRLGVNLGMYVISFTFEAHSNLSVVVVVVVTYYHQMDNMYPQRQDLFQAWILNPFQKYSFGTRL